MTYPLDSNFSYQKERRAYEVIIKDGKLFYKQSGIPVNSVDGTKWIFVLSTSRTLYVGQVYFVHVALYYNLHLAELCLEFLALDCYYQPGSINFMFLLSSLFLVHSGPYFLVGLP